MQPLLDSLSQALGFPLSLVGGKAPMEPDGQWDLLTVHSGATAKGQNFFEFDPAAFEKQVVGSLARFLWAVKHGRSCFSASG